MTSSCISPGWTMSYVSSTLLQTQMCLLVPSRSILFPDKLFDGTYPNVSVIQLEPFYKLPLYKNSTPTFEFRCKALDFVLAPRAYLRVLMHNSSTSMLFTSGTTLSQQGRRRMTDYGFELELDVNMRRIECLGIDSYLGVWRSSGRAIEVKCKCDIRAKL